MISCNFNPQGVKSEEFQFNILSLKELESNDSKIKNKFLELLKDGFFYLEMPNECADLIQEGEAFANSFYTSEKIKKTELQGFGGYKDRNNLQVESHIAERVDWDRLVEEKIYSEKLVELAKRMNALGAKILKKTLITLGIPEKYWDELSGNLTIDKGLHHFSFNHYRADKKDLHGLRPHKDYGFITILFVNSHGLQGKVKDKWIDVPPRKGYFIINFGRCLEIITGDCGKVNAIEHRVPSVANDRMSFGIFIDGQSNLPIKSYDYESQSIYKVYDSYEEYIISRFQKSYIEASFHETDGENE